MGRRLLRNRILHPLQDGELVKRRLDMVETLYRGQDKLKNLRDLLSKTPDRERLGSRLAMDKAHGKDMIALKNALTAFDKIEAETSDALFSFESPDASQLNEFGCEKLISLKELLGMGIAEDPSVLLSEGNLIKDGFNKGLDRLRQLRDSGRKLLEDYLEEERRLTGIQGLKIKYNRLIGYFFEVNNVNISKVPARFIRRQGIAGGERFTTDGLAAMESEINGASDRIIELEKKLFLEIREQAKAVLYELSAAGKRIAETDAAQSLARAATIHGWTRPVIDNENRTFIREGRHPVVEAHLSRGEFIPNDVVLDARDCDSGEGGSLEGIIGGNDESTLGISFALITGPNMAGKSTYLRQAALITLMAQAGSFVPASNAVIGLVDRIFCRVGAQDNLARGESTFLVEMNETAFILHTATKQSLVIMDEVGRGTGTEDGLSIAWAVCEELLDKIKCRTLFATHYHELSRIVHSRMANRSLEVEERDGGIIFLRKLKEGPAAGSYGLHVASLAGMSESLIKRAAEIFAIISERKQKPDFLAGKDFSADSPGTINTPYVKKESFLNGKEADVLKELSGLEINSITPLDALNLMQKWKKMIKTSAKSRAINKVRSLSESAEKYSLFD
jgi:DNA mismatch repair protein MutS